MMDRRVEQLKDKMCDALEYRVVVNELPAVVDFKGSVSGHLWQTKTIRV